MGELTNGNKTKNDESNLIVALRVRPLNEDEIIQCATPVAHKVDDTMLVLMDPFDGDDILRANRSREKQYVFDKVFDGSVTQAEVYNDTAKLLIPTILDGFNATVFAYGATGTGKTYSMLGKDDDPGLMAAALNDLFLEMEKSKDDFAYTVTLSYLEIYNEMIRDLLNPCEGYLELREDTKGVQVAGLSEVNAKSPEEVMAMLMKGNKERTQEPTAANKTSSRSHAVLQVAVKRKDRVRSIIQQVRIGKLYLIDLAGSERAANTHNKGKRMVEGAHINRSLLALGNCINALCDKNGSKYVNYRDSKLTRLLKDSLGGNCKTIMIAHISPASIHFEESRNTLSYADRAKQIKTKVRKNVLDVSYHIVQYTSIISELRDEIEKLRKKLDLQDGMKHNFSMHDFEGHDRLISQNEDHVGLNKLKNELLNVFKRQMDVKRMLTELNTAEMDLSFNSIKNSLSIQRWEREKSYHKKKKSCDIIEQDEDFDKDTDTEKNFSEEKIYDGEDEEPFDVKDARDKMKIIDQEKERIESQKIVAEKDYIYTRESINKLYENIHAMVVTEEQNEILSLLRKVHQLEIDNMELKSSCMLRNFALKRSHIIITNQQNHHSLCDEIIHQQKHMLENSGIASSKELDELYDLYQMEKNERPESPDQNQISLPDIKSNFGSCVTLNKKLFESDSYSDLGHDDWSLETPSLPYLNSALKSSATNSNQEIGFTKKEDKLFSKSAKIKELQAINASVDPRPKDITFLKRQPSIVTISTSGNTSPKPTHLIESIYTNHKTLEQPRMPSESPTVISSKTRDIAALAAHRKGKVHSDVVYEHITTSNDKRQGMLTQSRLAHHDKKFTNSAVLKHLSEYDADIASIGTADHCIYNDSFNTHRSLKPIKYKTKSDKKQKKSVRSQETFNYQRKYMLKLETKQTNNGSMSNPKPINNSLTSLNTHQQKTKLPQPKNRNVPLKPVKITVGPSDRLNVTATSTPPTRHIKKHPLSIPNYGLADVSITGQGFR